MKALPLYAAALAALAFLTPVFGAEPDPTLKALVAGSQRGAGNTARDPYRHPAEMLAFGGLKPDMNVVEMLPGGGYWTEIVAPYVNAKGHYLAVTSNPDSAATPALKERFAKGLQAIKDRLAAKPELYSGAKIALLSYDPASKSYADLAPAGSADFVLLCRNIHDFMGAHQPGDSGPYTIDALLLAINKVLKPGGVLLIEDHRGDPGKPQDPRAHSGYLREDFAIALVEKAGFKLAAKSELLANPKDTKDYPGGVFFLPPGERAANLEPLSPEDKAKAEAIGESDRFLLKFVKPKA